MHTSNYNYKYTFSVEVAPLCKVGPLHLLCAASWLGCTVLLHQTCRRIAPWLVASCFCLA